MAEYTPFTNLRGPAARITNVAAQSVPADKPASVSMTGPDQNRSFVFEIPRGLPGVDAMPANEAFAAYVNAEGPARDALVANFGRVHRPEAYGAVGDGVADDLPAFQAIRNAMLANVDIPHRIEVSALHYLSDGISFDAERIEVVLTEGAHIFTTKATSGGHTLGLIGHDGLGTATTPKRKRFAVLGPGKITGWTGAGDGTTANNENAIGVIRVEELLVDGPQRIVAGNKALTTQYGVERVTVRNFDVQRADYRGVGIEDGATQVVVESLNVDECGGAALVVSAEDVRVRGVTAGVVMKQGNRPSGPYNPPGGIEAAVRVTGPALRVAELFDVRVKSAGAGKGMVVSNASVSVLVDNFTLGAADLSPVELQNVTAPTMNVGAVFAPSSGAPVVAVGTTSASAIRRFGQRAPDAIGINVSQFLPVLGNPAVGAITGMQIPLYLLDADASEAVAALLPGEVIPPHWGAFAVEAVWVNTTGATGSVRLDSSYAWLGDGDPFTTGTFVTGTPVAAPTIAGQQKTTRLIPSVTTQTGKRLYLRVIRNGPDGGDSLPNDCGLVAVRLVRVS